MPTGESALTALLMATTESSKLLIGAVPTLTTSVDKLNPAGIEFDYVPAVEHAEGIDDQKVNETSIYVHDQKVKVNDFQYGRMKG